MTTRLFAVVAALLMPAAAVAQWDDPPPQPDAPVAPAAAVPDSGGPKLRGFELSLALGYAIPFGDYYQSDSGQGAVISDEISGGIPIVFGAGYRINPQVSVGATFQYGEGFVKSDACPSGASCSASDYRLSFGVRFHFMAEQSFSPWISVGLGYEWLPIEVSEGRQSGGASIAGLEFMNLEFGGDFRVSPDFTIGPFVGLWVGKFSRVSADGDSVDIPSDNQSFHGWIALGVRGAFVL